MFKRMALRALSPSSLFFSMAMACILLCPARKTRYPNSNCFHWTNVKTLPPRRQASSISARPVTAPALNLRSKRSQPPANIFENQRGHTIYRRPGKNWIQFSENFAKDICETLLLETKCFSISGFALYGDPSKAYAGKQTQKSEKMLL